MERQFLDFSLLNQIKGLRHAVSLRHGGVSQGPYASLNMGDNTGDNPVDVEKNQKRVFDTGGFLNVARLDQVHGINIISTTKGGVFQGDALITQEKEVTLMIRHADCQAAIFYDKGKGQIACVHAGWRGLVSNIYGEVVKALNTDPKDILVAIAPSLGPKYAYYPEFPLKYRGFMEQPHHYNFWDLAEKQLEELGIQEIHIERVCTYEHHKDYYSYRRDKETGRHATLVMLDKSFDKGNTSHIST
ncbi:MAG: peptidoglycan editing factor PgeF [Simkaniaceae bacterium]|nr:peptidoglycan editing factor PgeF [Simkaniaceae bacterium]